MMKKFFELCVSLAVVGILLYIVVYVIAGFPPPKWAAEGLQETRQELRVPN